MYPRRDTALRYVLIACLAVLVAVMGLTLWKGAELTAPANPAEAYSAARPEWYFLFLFQLISQPYQNET